MSDVYYPDALPPPLAAGYELDDAPTVSRDEMDDGWADQRLLDETLRTEHPIVFKFTKNQLLLWEPWYRYKVGFTGWFWMMLEGGMGLQLHECRFKADALPRAPRQIGGFYYVQATIETRDRPMLTEDEYDLLIDEDIDALIASLGTIHDALIALSSP